MSTPIASTPAITTWNLDPAHSSAEFKVRHMMISNVKGSFRGLKGVLKLDEADPTQSSVMACGDVNTLATGDEQRDTHLKSGDFFDAAQYPEICFKSSSIKKTAEGEFQVAGELTLHGVSRPVTFVVEGMGTPGKDPWGNVRIGLSATAKVNRKDFGLTWNSTLETGGVLVGDEVALTIDAEFIKSSL